ncbi:MAG: cobalamin B12-binding domain-containing protein [Deltaproteobacteria bacterium]|nr:cobalamin B12-binding domain-containing protein [Deltaproteobacteria bacterium]
MRILLVRPASPNERFGLGPFFRVEPLGLEYVAAALRSRGHEVRLADLRFSSSLRSLLRWHRPRMVGIASAHTVDFGASAQVAREVKRHDPSITTLMGGHAVAAFPGPLSDRHVDAIALDDGEVTAPAVAEALTRGRPLSDVPGLSVRKTIGLSTTFERTASLQERTSLDEIPLPARDLVAPFQKHYHVVHKSPLWALETARGCPYRCSFCSIWRLLGRSCRVRRVDAVCEDFRAVGDNVFVVDDLFWHMRSRSLELGEALARSRVCKEFVLVQSRLDTVARNPDLLRVWRPLARYFDIFFGFEAPTARQLDSLDKDLRVESIEDGVRVARDQGFGVTGNFVIDPGWDEHDFQAMWDMVDRLQLTRAGYTILTPLPGTPLYDEVASRIVEKDWSKFDMHHILYEPKLGRRRFFELFAKSWRRNVLGPAFSLRAWVKWMRQVKVTEVAMLARILAQTQRNMNAESYLAEAFPLQIPAR